MPKSPSYPRSNYSRYRAPVVDRVNLMVFLRRSLRMFRSRWWIALLSTIIGSGTSIYLATTQPDIYRATSVLGIAPRVAFAQRGTDRATVLEEKHNFVQDQLSYMRGSQVLGKVEEKMQDFRLPDNSTPTKLLSVAAGAGSTFVMTVDSPNLEYARRFARTWASEFLAYKEELRGGAARRRMDKTRVDLSRQEEAVAEARQRLDDYLQEHQIATSQDTGNAAQEQLVALQRRRQAVMLERQRLELKSAESIADERSTAMVVKSPAGGAGVDSASLTAADPAGSPTDLPDPFEKFGGASSYRTLKLRLKAIDSEIQRQSDKLKPKHPYMVQLADSRGQVEREIGHQLALIDEMRKAEIVSLRQEETTLDRQIETQRAEVVRLRDISREFQRRTEEYSSQSRLLGTLQSELQALTQIQSEDEDIKILEEGSASDKPIGPKRRSMIVSGVAFGFLSGLGLIFLLHRLDDRIDSAEDLEKALDEPILGQLPFVNARDSRDGVVSIDKLETNNIFAEALRGVRSSIMFGELGGSKQVLMATSSVPGDGKSTFTVNFAITLANAGNRVLLIDADLRRGTVAGYFGVPSTPGLSEVLSGLESWKDVLCGVPEHKTLLVIPAGKSVTNPGELLLSKGIKRLIEEVRRDFDYVIFDSPPVIGMDDAASLSSSCDGLVFVYRVGVTSLKLAKLAVNTVRQRGGQILGVILNGVSVNSPDYYYTAYYYSHYTYGRSMRPVLPEGEAEAEAEAEAGRPQRPRGARLLAAMQEADSGGATEPGSGAPTDPSLALLGDEPGPVDVQATPAMPKKGTPKPDKPA